MPNIKRPQDVVKHIEVTAPHLTRVLNLQFCSCNVLIPDVGI
jgi:hypothetical protein